MRRTYTARPTVYNGVHMRSRLEASFAASLDAEGDDWMYEPQCFASSKGQYLPEFMIRALPDRPVVYIEVKPTFEMAVESMDRMEIIWSSIPYALLWSVYPDRDMWGLVTWQDGKLKHGHLMSDVTKEVLRCLR